ncbi:quinone-dependent dihydroorotate dehydrogenase [Mobiluncus porci]|uniref:Dihydroorotate dehydrogenase (quinone) n=1 Tax=Mobiluncus porci TaxID=2652278 RepID=A0A7K0JZU8_9ACTO|nr:quinone-dependent dihydroorotate dehydrogenase [Mobiluncus porci]MST48781.1 quinone-dependent dihydroorotate dehydrogenase [Mobiluncus porci]
MYKFLFRHVLVKLDAEWVHRRAIEVLEFAGRFGWVRKQAACLVKRPEKRFEWPLKDNSGTGKEQRIYGPLGLAAGMDKEARAVPMWDALGFGFVEIGTITPLAQPGNDRPRLWRLPEQRALRNAMGFNNEGARVAARRLKRLRFEFGNSLVIGANIGKNKVTPAEKAPSDYRKVTRSLASLVDFLVINVSSPNTPGLRDLQAVSSLTPIVRAVQKELQLQDLESLPVFVKIAPDLADDDVIAVADLAVKENLAGVVATNTTIKHDLGAGGLSGEPLRERALEVVALLRSRLPEDKTIIGVGGITTAGDARAMLEAGANLVEGISAFIYEGPDWAARLNRELTD